MAMIHDTWKPAHGIPASGTCICHVSSCIENWNHICVHTDVVFTALCSRHRRTFVAFVSVVHSLVKLDCLPSRAVIWLYLGLTPVCHSRSYCLREVSCDRVWRGLCSGA